MGCKSTIFVCALLILLCIGYSALSTPIPSLQLNMRFQNSMSPRNYNIAQGIAFIIPWSYKVLQKSASKKSISATHWAKYSLFLQQQKNLFDIKGSKEQQTLQGKLEVSFDTLFVNASSFCICKCNLFFVFQNINCLFQ